MNINKMWKELYLELQANPFEKMTDIEFCEANGISHASFKQWKYENKTEINKEIERRRKPYLSQLRSTAYKSLVRKLEGGDVNALKLFFQLSGDLIERTENRTEVMSPQDLKRGINEMLKDIIEKKKAWGGGETVEAGTPTPKEDVSGGSNEPKHEPGKDLPPTGKV